ncbi:MAG: S8 family serine peptidase, partial [Saprospiraceae bacterium]
MYRVILPMILLLSQTLFSQSTENWKNKVSDFVFDQYQNNEEVEYFIYLKDSPDISEVKNIKSKTEKTTYIYNTLKDFSKISQKDIVLFLKSKNLKFKSYIIANAILVKSDYETMKFLANDSQVKAIAGNPSTKQKSIEDRILAVDRDPNSLAWGVENINANDLWDLGYTGSGVVIGGQDTGYKWTHEALQDKYRGWDGAVANHNYNWHDAIHSIDTHNTGSNPCGLSIDEPCDDHGHGTHTMGTMVGSSGTNDIGVAPGAQWIGCRNMERGYGTPSTYLECFEWFLAPTDLNDENPTPSLAPDVINNSWSCPADEGCNSSNYSIMETAIDNLTAAGIVVVVSAGNSGPNCSSISDPPAFFQNSFTVGATNSSDTIASFSSRGPTSGYNTSLLKPDISAPGVSIRSSTYDSNSSYGYKSGTSMAGPHVAGAVALLIDAFPELYGDVSQITDLIEQSATYLDTDQTCNGITGAQVPNNTYGYGKLDVLAAYNHY